MDYTDSAADTLQWAQTQDWPAKLVSLEARPTTRKSQVVTFRARFQVGGKEVAAYATLSKTLARSISAKDLLGSLLRDLAAVVHKHHG